MMISMANLFIRLIILKQVTETKRSPGKRSSMKAVVTMFIIIPATYARHGAEDEMREDGMNF